MLLEDGDDPVQADSYDGVNRRVVRLTYVSGDLDESRDYYYSAQWQSVEERIDNAATEERTLVWGLRYIDDLTLRDRPQYEGRLFALQDANWNIDAVVAVNANIQERYSYTSYGAVAYLTSAFSDTSSSMACDTLYAGYQKDSGSELYHVRRRYLHSGLGTWITRDPIVQRMLINRPVINLYWYADDTPLIVVDPFGLDIRGPSDWDIYQRQLEDFLRGRRRGACWRADITLRAPRLKDGYLLTGDCPNWQLFAAEIGQLLEEGWNGRHVTAANGCPNGCECDYETLRRYRAMFFSPYIRSFGWAELGVPGGPPTLLIEDEPNSLPGGPCHVIGIIELRFDYQFETGSCVRTTRPSPP